MLTSTSPTLTQVSIPSMVNSPNGGGIDVDDGELQRVCAPCLHSTADGEAYDVPGMQMPAPSHAARATFLAGRPPPFCSHLDAAFGMMCINSWVVSPT